MVQGCPREARADDPEDHGDGDGVRARAEDDRVPNERCMSLLAVTPTRNQAWPRVGASFAVLFSEIFY